MHLQYPLEFLDSWALGYGQEAALEYSTLLPSTQSSLCGVLHFCPRRLPPCWMQLGRCRCGWRVADAKDETALNGVLVKSRIKGKSHPDHSRAGAHHEKPILNPPLFPATTSSAERLHQETDITPPTSIPEPRILVCPPIFPAFSHSPGVSAH